MKFGFGAERLDDQRFKIMGGKRICNVIKKWENYKSAAVDLMCQAVAGWLVSGLE